MVCYCVYKERCGKCLSEERAANAHLFRFREFNPAVVHRVPSRRMLQEARYLHRHRWHLRPD